MDSTLGERGRSMSAVRWVVSLVASLLVGGCGLTVPEIQEFPGTPGDGQLLVQAIVQSVHCEVVDAVNDLYKQAKKYPQVKILTDKLDKWGVQMALSLTTEEKSTLNPTAVWTPVSPATAIFTLGGSGLLSSDATRINKLNFYYTMKEIKARGYCARGVQPEAPVTSLLIQSDLKLGEWLADQMIPVGTNEVILPTSPNGIFKQNVLSQEVKFDVVSTAGVTPAWKLVRATVNQTGTLFAATRDRTHDLIITFGPGNATGLTGQAANTHLASEIGLSVSNNLRSVVLP
jgi:hypothetical protein